MRLPSTIKLIPVSMLLLCAFAQQAQAATQVVSFNTLNASATLPTPLLGGDSLVLDTLVTGQVGSLLQTINFTVGATSNGISGDAVWQISTATGLGPRLIGVNLDIFNNTTNALVVSDGGVTVAGAFAVSSFAATALTPGSYRLVATGTAVRDAVLNVTLNLSAVPEANTLAMLLAGLAVVAGVTARRRRI